MLHVQVKMNEDAFDVFMSINYLYFVYPLSFWQKPTTHGQNTKNPGFSITLLYWPKNG